MLRDSKITAPRALGATLGALVVALAGCGDVTATAPVDPGAGGPEPTTARALAAVAVEYAGEPSSAEQESDAAERFASNGIGVRLRYGSTGESDGDLLEVATGTDLDASQLDCDGERAPFLDGCVTTEEGLLVWEEVEPEEDPGLVVVVVEKGDGAARLLYAGPDITGDPRELDLPIPVETLFDIATDPRVDVTTSAEAVDAGEDLSYWRDSGD